MIYVTSAYGYGLFETKLVSQISAVSLIQRWREKLGDELSALFKYQL